MLIHAGHTPARKAPSMQASPTSKDPTSEVPVLTRAGLVRTKWAGLLPVSSSHQEDDGNQGHRCKGREESLAAGSKTGHIAFVTVDR